MAKLEPGTAAPGSQAAARSIEVLDESRLRAHLQRREGGRVEHIRGLRRVEKQKAKLPLGRSNGKTISGSDTTKGKISCQTG